MTVALVLAAQADAGLRGQLAALGVRQVDAADQGGPGLLTIAAAAQAAGERVLVCVGDEALPEEILARLLQTGRTAAFIGAPSRDGQPGHGAAALLVDEADLDALADAAESLVADYLAGAPETPLHLGELIGELTHV